MKTETDQHTIQLTNGVKLHVTIKTESEDGVYSRNGDPGEPGWVETEVTSILYGDLEILPIIDQIDYLLGGNIVAEIEEKINQ